MPCALPLIVLAFAPNSGSPQVLVAVPTASATVSGLVHVRGDLAHARPIAKVDLLADGRAVASAASAKEFAFTWDATKASRGKHTLTVKASDADGRVGMASVDVFIRQTFDVKERGARGNGKTDDTQAIQAALDAARKAGGGTVYFPKGTYVISPRTTGGFAVGSNTEVRGDGPASVLKIADNAGNYNFLFGQLNAASNFPFVENVSFRDLRVDQNPGGNRTADIRETEGIQNVLQFHHFRNLSVERVHFDPEAGIQAVVLDSPKPNTGGVVIDGCFFRFVRGRSTLAHKHDHSSIYTETRNVVVRNNTFRADISQSAVTAIEVHGGPHVRVQGNKADGFQVGVIVVNAAAPNPDVADGRFVVRANQILRTTQGVALWSHTGRTLRGVTVKDNRITMARHLLYRDVWLGVFLYDNEADGAARGDFENIAIVNNNISFENLTPGTVTAAGIDLAPAGRVRDVLVKGNTILASPATGIRVGNAARGKALQDVRVEGNTIVDAGCDATAPKQSRAAILLDTVRLTNVHVTQNVIKDTGKPGAPAGIGRSGRIRNRPARMCGFQRTSSFHREPFGTTSTGPRCARPKSEVCIMSPPGKMIWALRRALGRSPTQRVLRELERRGLCLHEMKALEVFAHCGFLHGKDFHRRVRSLEAWELDPQQEAALRRNLPGAEIKITDSYAEIRRTPRRFDLIVIDAPESIFGDRGQYCEHFQMLPEVLRVAEDSAVIVLNALIGYATDKGDKRKFTKEQLEYRRQFYQTDHPEWMPLADMAPAYWRLLDAHGFELEWYVTVPRSLDKRMHYFVLKIKRRPAQPDLKG